MSAGMGIGFGRVALRGVEPADIEFMYGIENDLHNWGVSGTLQPFSRYLLERFVESQSEDIFRSRQLRMMVTRVDGGDVVGIVDLFEVDAYNHRAGVGIFIADGCRGEGYGADSLRALEGYCRDVLQLHQLWCGVEVDNEASKALFRSVGYVESGVRRDWLWRVGGYCDEVMMQRLL